MTSSGSRLRPSSRTPRSGAERHGSLWRWAWRIAVVLGATAAVAVAFEGDERGQGPTPGASEEARTRPGGITASAARHLQPPSPAAPRFGWHRTDFTKHSAPLSEFISGGPGKDGIPAIDHPGFVRPAAADQLLERDAPVAVVDLRGQARAYPLEILIWHEIVNDEIAGRPVVITYCPLCNSTLVFDRRVGGRALRFGTTGALRNADLVMYDHQTQSWWQQITGEAVVGKLTGTRLEVLPSQILSWRAFKRVHPGGVVLSFDTGYDRPYGRNPYVAYDELHTLPPDLDRVDQMLPPKARVAAVPTGRRSAAVFPFSRLHHDAPVNARAGGRAIVVFFDPTVTSPLDEFVISESRRAGAAAVFERDVAGRTLRFAPSSRPGVVVDTTTGSEWDMSGRAIAGPLAGAELRQVTHDDQFWFALAAFYPRAEIRR